MTDGFKPRRCTNSLQILGGLGRSRTSRITGFEAAAFTVWPQVLGPLGRIELPTRPYQGRALTTDATRAWGHW